MRQDQQNTQNPTQTTDTQKAFVNMSKIKNIEQKMGVCKNAPVPSKS